MKIKTLFVLSILTATFLFGCRKNEYFNNTGLANGQFDGTIMQYLESKPDYFDSLVKIINIAGMAEALNKPNITFFAPPDSTIRAALFSANVFREQNGRARINSVNEISPAIWRKHLSKYIFNFAKSLNDFSQVDFSNITSYGGQMYTSYAGRQMNIGAVYTDLVNRNPQTQTVTTIRYAGYRYLVISFLTSPFSPTQVSTWVTAPVSTANIRPNNGFVHIIKYSNHQFGFDVTEFSEDVTFLNNN